MNYLIKGNIPLVCGGANNDPDEDGNYFDTDTCYNAYNSQLIQMHDARMYGTSIVMPEGDKVSFFTKKKNKFFFCKKIRM